MMKAEVLFLRSSAQIPLQWKLLMNKSKQKLCLWRQIFNVEGNLLINNNNIASHPYNFHQNPHTNPSYAKSWHSLPWVHPQLFLECHHAHKEQAPEDEGQWKIHGSRICYEHGCGSRQEIRFGNLLKLPFCFSNHRKAKGIQYSFYNLFVI